METHLCAACAAIARGQVLPDRSDFASFVVKYDDRGIPVAKQFCEINHFPFEVVKTDGKEPVVLINASPIAQKIVKFILNEGTFHERETYPHLRMHADVHVDADNAPVATAHDSCFNGMFYMKSAISRGVLVAKQFCEANQLPFEILQWGRGPEKAVFKIDAPPMTRRLVKIMLDE